MRAIVEGDLILSARSSFLFLSSSLTQNRALKFKMFARKSDVLGVGEGGGGGEGRRGRGEVKKNE